MDTELVSETLEALSDADTQRKRRKHLKPFRGLRGTPVAEVTRVLAHIWSTQRLELPADTEVLHSLFCTAWEDGIVAIGLLAALAPDQPFEAVELAERWLEHVDDVESADALGWLVLGPGVLASGEGLDKGLEVLARSPRPYARRAVVMACMAGLPVPITGPAAAALRVRLGQRRVAMVEAPRSEELERLLPGLIRDADPHVRKAVGRVIRCWGEVEPERVQDFIDGIRGGISKQLRAEIEKGVRKGRRRARDAGDAQDA